MYLCEYKYLAWHGKSAPIRLYRVVKSHPSKDYFIRRGVKIPYNRNTKLTPGTSVLIRYAKIGDKMNWVYNKKKGK